MGDASVNGDMPQSATLDHIVSYPIVHDGIEYFKANPLGQRSIEITNAAYGKFVKPTLPYFETPASYAKPYAIKVDEYGNLFLTKIDEKIPILKSETEEVKTAVVGYIQWPVEKAGEARVWVVDTFSDEYKKCGGDGLVAGGKAIIATSLVTTSEILNKLSTYLAAKKEEAKEVAADAADKAQEKTSS